MTEPNSSQRFQFFPNSNGRVAEESVKVAHCHDCGVMLNFEPDCVIDNKEYCSTCCDQYVGDLREGEQLMATTNPTPTIKVGDYVRLRGTEQCIGKVAEVRNARLVTITVENGEVVALEEALEVAPRLTQDEAWAELPYLILAELNTHRMLGAVRVYEVAQTNIRHKCYKLLGGSGIKVTDEVKARVRKAIARVASELGVELA